MIPRVPKHSVIARPVGGYAFDVSVRGHTVRTDQPAPSGGNDTAPTPLELLSVAFAGCVALYVERYCVSHGLDSRGTSVEVNPVWRPDSGRIGRFDVLLHLPASIPESHHDAIEIVARSCPVHQTLAHAPEIRVDTIAQLTESASVRPA